MAHRKWKEIMQQPSMLPGPAVPGSCFASFHFLWAIHPIRPVHMMSTKFSDFLPPPILICIFTQSPFLNFLSPYCICFWGTPLPVQTSYMYMPPYISWQGRMTSEISSFRGHSQMPTKQSSRLGMAHTRCDDQNKKRGGS